MSIITKIFGSKHDRDTKKIVPIVEEINRFYEEYHSLSDEELKAKTDEFKNRIEERRNEIRDSDEEWDPDELDKELLEAEKEVLDDILPEAFASVKEVCRRLMGKSWNICEQKIIWDMIPFDVQLVGAVVLHQGKIAEMATGEGKTLVATMPMYLNALLGRGVHLVTVNDYLAKRDSEWMGEIFKFLGLTVGCILNDMTPDQRKEIYRCDITYGTNNEFGFDYLRDNMSISMDDVVQKGHYYAIIDEVDSVLIDEARTPLIISGPVSVSTHKYKELKPSVERVIRQQNLFVNNLVSEAEKYLEKEEDYDAGINILRAFRGSPKNKKLMKLLNEVGIKKLMRQVENDFLRDKRMPEIDEELYFCIDEKTNVVDLMEKGRSALSPEDKDMFILPDLATEVQEIEDNESMSLEEKERKKEEFQRLYHERSEKNHNVAQLLKAYSLFEKDVEYVVKDGKVLIVDEFTGRILPGRRYSDGLHQALESKENVQIERETQTLATITLQNYFRLYDKLAGMTGTAETEAGEFWEIYKLDVTVTPTNKPVIRDDMDDQIYKTKREKYNAVIDEIEQMIEEGRPVLVGTVNVDVSETLSRMLKRRGVRHSVLNAKHHQQEAEIVTNAGRSGVVTIATNMAGRGTDIKLGEGVRDAGGLHIISTERHEARRIDLQLRGRAGRQGDPGSSKFFLSLEDDLMRLFSSDRVAGVMDRMGVQDGDVIMHPLITKSIERAQKKVEAHNFSIRKHLLEYDDVMNQQREVVYSRRQNCLKGENIKSEIFEMLDEFIEDKVYSYINPDVYAEEWDLQELNNSLIMAMLLNLKLVSDNVDFKNAEELVEYAKEKAREHYEKREKGLGEDTMRQLERLVVLRVIDEKWKEHLYETDQIKEGIGLRAYGQKDPLIEYKQESYRTFVEMLKTINQESIELIFKAQIGPPPSREQRRADRYSYVKSDSSGMGYDGGPEEEESERPRAGKKAPVKVEKRVGRNDPCPCGSGKKYKKCCGRDSG
ncbi:preprotein translocase subunit SecA [candidate division KSB1 bacterium]